MSTAIDFGALMRRAKASKSQSPSSTPTGPSKTAAASLAQAKLQLRPLNPKSLEEAYKVSPEGLERAFYVPDFVTPEEEAYILDMIAKSEEEEERSGKWISLSHRRLKVFGGTPDAQGTLHRKLPIWVDALITQCVEPCLHSTPPIDSFKQFDHVLLNEYSHGSGIAPHFDGPLYDSRVCVLNLQSRAVISFWKAKSEEKEEGLQVQKERQVDEKGDESAALQPSYHNMENAGASTRVQAQNSSPLMTEKNEAFCLVLEPRSLLIFEGALYTDYKHGIANAKEDDVSSRKIGNIRFLSSPSCDTSLPLSRGNLPRLSLTLRSIKHRSERSTADVMTSVEKEELRRSEIQFYRNVSELN